METQHFNITLLIKFNKERKKKKYCLEVEGKMEKNMEKNKIEVLLVEDNPADAELTYIALEKNRNIAQSEIHLAKDGIEAIQYIFGDEDGDGYFLSHRPQLILLDLNIPKLTGLDVLKKIKEHSEAKDIPIVVLTGSQDEMDWIESYSIGVECFLRKSMDFDKFIEAAGWALMGAVDREKTYNFQPS